MAEMPRTTPRDKAPAPLTAAEVGVLWQTERKAMRLYAFAVTVLAAALALPHVFPQGASIGYVVLIVALLLIVSALVMQLRVRCPRCQTRLATQSLLLMPERCKCCGVTIAHPAGLDGELDA